MINIKFGPSVRPMGSEDEPIIEVFATIDGTEVLVGEITGILENYGRSGSPQWLISEYQVEIDGVPTKWFSVNRPRRGDELFGFVEAVTDGHSSARGALAAAKRWIKSRMVVTATLMNSGSKLSPVVLSASRWEDSNEAEWEMLISSRIRQIVERNTKGSN